MKETIARDIAEHFSKDASVYAVVWAGSQTGSHFDDHSDIDLYVYTTNGDQLLPTRYAAADRFSDPEQPSEIDNRFWESGDEWIHKEEQIKIDLTYRHPEWIEEQLDRLLVHHQASVGYSTCFWYNVLVSKSLVDREGWYANLQARAKQPYPDALAQAIIEKNLPLLGKTLSSYPQQIKLAIERHDRVCVQHRLSAFLASYFDVLFAINKQLHPGEKRLIPYIEDSCSIRPENLGHRLEAAMIESMQPWERIDLLRHLDSLTEDLVRLL
jgi:hypothetical protein